MKTRAPAHRCCRQGMKKASLESFVFSLHINRFNTQRTDQFKMLVNRWHECETSHQRKLAVALATQELTTDVVLEWQDAGQEGAQHSA